MIYLYITRHGMTKWNQEGRLQGHGDSPLTAQGIEDAVALQKLMATYPIDIIYSSPLKRANDTACLIFPNRDIILDNRLKEMSFGDYEGCFVSELLDKKEYDNLWNHPESFERIKNGESFAEVSKRLLSFLKDIEDKHEGKHVFITIHGMLYVVLMSIIKNVPTSKLNTLNRKIIRGGALTIVQIDGENYRIIEEALQSHLEACEVMDYTKKEA